MDSSAKKDTPGSDGMKLALLSLDNPVFCCYLFWCSVLVLKTLLMALLTAIQRYVKKVVSNPEDMRMNSEVRFDDVDVERVRRAHLNDLENILPFLIIALVYTATDPHPLAARMLFRIAAVARILHTLVYAFRPVPQPSRAICFFIPFGITMFMAFYVAARTIRFI